MDLRRYSQVRAPLRLPLGYALVFPVLGVQMHAVVGHVAQILFRIEQAGDITVSESGYIRQTLAPLTQAGLGVIPDSGSIHQMLNRILQEADAHARWDLTGSAHQRLLEIIQRIQGETNHAEVAMVLRAIQQQALGGMQVAGSISDLLAFLRQHAEGRLPITGVAEQILRSVEQHAFVHVPPAGVIDQQLALLSQRLEAKTVNAEGAIAELLDGIAQAINAEVAIIHRGHIAMTVGRPILIEISAAVGPTGRITQRLERFSQEALVMFNPAGRITQQLFPIISTAVGSRSASIDQLLFPIRQSFVAGMESFGTAAQRLAQISETGEMVISAKGVISQQLRRPTMTGAFLVSQYYGAVAQTLSRVMSNIDASANLTATANQVLPRLYQGAAAYEIFAGHSYQVLKRIEQNVQVAVSASWGTIAQALPRIIQEVEGYMPPAGLAVQVLPRLRSDGYGWAEVRGNAAPVLSRVQDRAYALESMVGTGHQELYPQRLLVHGEGSALNYGHIVQDLFPLTQAVDGRTTIIGGIAQRLFRVIQDGGGLAPTYGTMEQLLPIKVSQAVDAGVHPSVRVTSAITLFGISQDVRGYRAVVGDMVQHLAGGLTTTAMGTTESGGGVIDEEKMIPNGRLTLVSGSPWQDYSVAAGSTIYYAPAIGTTMYYWTGATMASETFAELSQALSDTTHSPAAAVANARYDLFVWRSGGNFILSRGPAWVSAKNRGTGAGSAELKMQAGFFVNAHDITNGPAAGYGIYVGSIRTDHQVKVNYQITQDYEGSTQSTPLYNAFNQRQAAMSLYDGAGLTSNDDPYLANVQLLLTANSDGTITDKSLNTYPFAKKGTVTTSTAVSKFGNYVIDLSAAGDHGLWNGTASANFVMFRTNAVWTYECWINYVTLPSNADIVCNRIGGGTGSWIFTISNLLYIGSRPSSDNQYNTGFSFTTGRWYHVAIQCNNLAVQVFVDGVSVWTGNVSSCDAATMPLGIGQFNNDSSGNPASGFSFRGYMDQIRWTRDVLRYTGNFTVPTEPFPAP